MVLRSKKSIEGRSDRVTDTTYHAPIVFYEGMEELVYLTMTLLGQVKAADFVLVQRAYNLGGVFPRDPRVARMCSLTGMTQDLARSIVEANDAIIDTSVKANKRNSTQWQKEYDETGDPRLLKKIERAKSLHVCLGSKKLFREAQKDPDKWDEWHDKRLFLGCGGTSGRIGGNRVIRLVPVKNSDTEYEVQVPLWDGVEWHSLVPIGTIEYTKRGDAQIREALLSRASVSYKIVKRGKKYSLHTTPAIEPSTLVVKDCSTGVNTVGIDLNSHHFDVSIVDDRANVLFSKTYDFGVAGVELDKVVKQAFRDFVTHGVGTVGIEILGGVNRKSSKHVGHSSLYVRKAVNQLPVQIFRSAVHRNCRAFNMACVPVSPKGTSADTIYYPEDMFGIGTHQKAGYLIARRTLGLSLRGRRTPELVETYRQRMVATIINEIGTPITGSNKNGPTKHANKTNTVVGVTEHHSEFFHVLSP